MPFHAPTTIARTIRFGLLSAWVGGCSGQLSTSAPDASSAAPDADNPTHDGASSSDAALGHDVAAVPIGDANDAGTPGADAGMSCQQLPPLPSTGRSCNGLAVSGCPVLETCASAPSPPPPTGGTIADGTYVMTARTDYGAACLAGQTAYWQGTRVVSGATWQVVFSTLDLIQGTPSGGDAFTISETVKASGTSLTVQTTCPARSAGSIVNGYSATPTTLNVYSPDPTNPFVTTWTKQ